MNWEIKKLNECCLSISDGDHFPPPKSESGIPFVTIANVDAFNHFDFTDTMYVPESYYDRLDDKRKARKGDILFTVVGSFGIPILITDNTPFVFQRHIAILRPDPAVIDSRFLYYTMLSKSFYAQADAYAIGAAQRTISLTSLRRMRIAVPNLEIQRKIADILAPFDSLINCNNTQIKLLEQMTEKLYKEWFVRFRFPGYETAEFENGIPKGWEYVKLGEYANISTGKCNREDAEEDGIYPLFDRSQETKKSCTWLKDCEAIIVPGEGTSFIPRYYKGKFNLHQRCYCVEPKIEKIGQFIFHTLMLNRIYFLYVATGATVPSLRQNNFTNMKLLMPVLDLVRKFEEITSVQLNQINLLKESNENLIKQRNLLLPRLMSGKLEV